MAIIFDNWNHDTATVYEYQKLIVNYLKQNFAVPKKIYYFTDGVEQYFKNKSNFANILAHKTDFKIPDKWHFHPTAHGKGPCDGVGATIKRNATKWSLQCSPKNHILDALSLYVLANNFSQETEILFSSKKYVNVTKN